MGMGMKAMCVCGDRQGCG